jgi:CSLREA domain-containing protein
MSRLEAAPALVTFTVNSALDQVDADTGDGLCLTAAGTCTLRAAIMQANTISGQGTEIILPAGTYTLTRPAAGANGPDSGDLNLTTPANGDPAIALIGAGAATTIIDANELDRVFFIGVNRRAIITGVTIRHGYIQNPDGVAAGGGIYNFGTLEISRSVVHFNTLIGDIAYGGGIASGGTLLLGESVISDNEVVGGNTGSGGGIYNFGRLDVDLSLIEGNATSGTFFEGGGITNNGEGAMVLLRRTTLRDNFTRYGGGIYNNNGRLVVTESLIHENTAEASGGGINNNNGTVEVHQSTIRDNESTGGGGIFNTGSLDVVWSEVSGNSALAEYAAGGGLYNNSSANARLITSTLSENISMAGGGLYNAGSLFLVNSTLSLNNAYDNAGGIYNDGTINAYNTTIVFNQADADLDYDGEAGGVFSRSGATFNLRNTLLAGNFRSGAPEYDECGGFINSYGINLIGIETLDGDSVNCAVDESFGPWAFLNDLSTIGGLDDNGGPTPTHALLPGSNAIDSGDPANGCVDQNSAVLPTDQRGAPRVAGERCDIGAFEFEALLPPTPAIELFLPVAIR